MYRPTAPKGSTRAFPLPQRNTLRENNKHYNGNNNNNFGRPLQRYRSSSKKTRTALSKSSTSSAPSSRERVIIYEPVKFESQIPHARRYIRGKLLGKGGFASCYEVTSVTEGTKYAVKVVEKKSLSAKIAEKLNSEIKIHSSVRHRHVVNFERYFEDKSTVYILLELCQCLSMMELMTRMRTLSEIEAKYFMLQIIDAVRFMHHRGIIHRDLKLGNLFLNSDMEIKIGDFGLATQLAYDGERKHTLCGTPNYMAPEILGNKPHGYEVDIWGLGVILYTLLVGQPPFLSNDIKGTYRNIKTGTYDFPSRSRVSHRARDLIIRILQNDPRLRPSLDEILEHSFFTVNPVDMYSCPDTLREYAIHTCSQSMNNMSSRTEMRHKAGVESRRIHHDTENVDPQLHNPKYEATSSGAKARAPLRQISNNNNLLQRHGSQRQPLNVLANAVTSGNMQHHNSPSLQKPHMQLQRYAFGYQQHKLQQQQQQQPPQEMQHQMEEQNVKQRQLLHQQARTLSRQKSYRDQYPQHQDVGDEEQLISNMHDRLERSLVDIESKQSYDRQNRNGNENLQSEMKVLRLGQIHALSRQSSGSDAYARDQSNENASNREGGSKAFVISPRESSPSHAVTDGHSTTPTTPTSMSQQNPQIWVTHWADFTEKYGMTYMLSNGTVGVLYNDYSKMTYEPNRGRIEYWERCQGKDGYYYEHMTVSMNNFPSGLHKKIRLISEFTKYLRQLPSRNDPTEKGKVPKMGVNAYQRGQADPVQVKNAMSSDEDNSSGPSSFHVKRWLLTHHAIIFRLSNRVVQVLFHDQSEIVLASEAKLVTYTSSHGQRETFPLEVCNSGQLPLREISVRLKYAKDIILSLISNPSQT